MTDNPDISLIIAVYNRAEVVRLVLAAVARQSFHNFEIVVADDGSDESVKAVVEEAKRIHGLALSHVWHEDKGWRKTAY